MSDTPPFDEAQAAFRKFIDGQGSPTDLLWVCSEDVTNCRRAWWVRVVAPAANERLARDYFEHGRRAGRGVTLEVLCRVAERSACFVWFPKDDKAASHALQGPLKLKVSIGREDAYPIRSRLGWWVRTGWNRWSECVDYSEFVDVAPASRVAMAGSSEQS